MKNIRKGPGYKWCMVQKTCMGEQHTSGFSIDNLDTKAFSDATSQYEKTFLTVREVLSAESYDWEKLISEEQKLQMCQDIADEIRNRRIWL